MATNGSAYLVVCSCGHGTYAFDLDEAADELRKSYILYQDGSHSHDTSTFACNIIEGIKDGEAGFLWGKILAPALVTEFDLGRRKPQL